MDARRKAMLREMGIRLWWPAAETATETAAETALPPKAAAPSAPRPEADQAAQAGARAASPTGPGNWQVGALQHLRGHDDKQAAAGPRWLLLAEQREETGGAAGDASALLERMLRAAGLHRGSQVWLAPMHRSPEGPALQGLEQALSVEPDLVFIMGRLAAQALLESSEPLGRLRGQVHELWGSPAVVSYDCVTLLRNPADKAKAWDDVCLALAVARQQHAERLASESD